MTKPVAGESTRKAGVKPSRRIVEFRGDPTDGVEVGAELKADVFAEGDKVAVTSTSRAKASPAWSSAIGLARGPVSHSSHNIL